MPSLEELKDKWFVFTDHRDPFSTTIRHTGSMLSFYTDNNLVTVLGEGADYIKVWYDLIQVANSRPGSTILHAGWNLKNIQCDASIPSSTAIDVLIDAAAHNPGNVYVLLNGDFKRRSGLEDVVETLNAGGVSAILDTNFPSAGSIHQKFFVQKMSDTEATALVGSCDVNSFNQSTATHELGVMIQGPAVRDLELTFLQRWNSPYNSPVPPIAYPPGNPTYPDAGPHSIQALRTYGSKLDAPAYEFSIWVSYLNAIKRADRYIYIEDQYFQTFDWPPCFERSPRDAPSSARNTDLVYQLAQAIKRGVKVVILTNHYGVSDAYYDEDTYNKKVSNYQREVSLEYLGDTAAATESGGDLIVGRLRSAKNNPHNYIHSKLMLVDDEFSILGSANFEQRSMTHDSELSIGIIDRDNLFSKNLRIRLLREHLKDPSADVEDWAAGFQQLKTAIYEGSGNVRLIPFTGERVYWHGVKLQNIVSPYAGPTWIREY